MNKLRIYLSGATKNVDEKFQDWRNKCLEFWDDGFYPGLKFINPISYFNYTNKQPVSDKQCLDLFMWQVEQCDVLLVNLDCSDKSIGTAMEIEHAFCNNKPIIAFGKNKHTWYNWIVERASVVFNSLDEAVEYINNTYEIVNR